MRRRSAVAAAGLVAAALCGPGGGRPCAAQHPPHRRVSPDLAEVLTATFIGTPGSEYLAAGAFLPNGTILLCGVSLEPEIALGGVKAAVLGRDTPPQPRLKAYRLLGRQSTGKMVPPTLAESGVLKGVEGNGPEEGFSLEDKALEAKKRPPPPPPRIVPRAFQWRRPETVEELTVYEKLTWVQPEATGFLAVVTGDLRTVRRLRRLPRGAGSITSAGVAADGAVYIAGAATERIAGLADDVSRRACLRDSREKNAKSEQLVYLARLSADLATVRWVRLLEGVVVAPRLCVLDDGDVALRSTDLRVYTPEGKLRRAFPITMSRFRASASADPVSGGFAKGGDFMTSTGHGPYRTPYVFIYGADGSLKMELYRWHGHLAGHGSLHLEADASILKTFYDHEGNLLLFGWTHGGNTALLRYPWDIDRFWPNPMGYFGISPDYVVKLGPDFSFKGATVWMSASRVSVPGCGIDGSVAWAGATGRVERLPNAPSEAPKGRAVVVAEPDLSAYRFFSSMPGCAERVALAGDTINAEDWGIVTGKIAGKPMVLFLTGAVDGETIDATAYPTPLRRPVQPSYAGGLMDGYALLLDLSRRPAPPAPPPPPPAKKQPPPDAVKRTRREAAPIVGGEGQVFRLGGEGPLLARMTFRDPKGSLWPTFYLGRAEPGGSFTYGTSKAQADFRVHCPHVDQTGGDQGRRVLGSLIRERIEQYTDARGTVRRRGVIEPEMRFVVKRMSPWKLDERTRERTSETLVYSVPLCSVDGQLHVGKRVVPVAKAPCEGRFHVPRGVDAKAPGVLPNQALLSITFALPGETLGLAGPPARQDIRVRVCCMAFSDVEYPKEEPIKPPTVKPLDTKLLRD